MSKPLPDEPTELLDEAPFGTYLLELRGLTLLVWRLTGEPLDDVEPGENWDLLAA
jgi:hypothetical protein